MICDLCDGQGLTLRPLGRKGRRLQPEPCPRCGGTGMDHCCSGDQPSAYDEQERALNDLACMGQDCDRQEGEG